MPSAELCRGLWDGCLAAAGPFCRPCNGAASWPAAWTLWRECFRWRLGLARTAGAEGAAHVADRSVLSLRGATFWAFGVWWWVCLSLQILQGRGLTRTYPWK